MNEEPKKIMSIKDENGVDHWIYGDEFVFYVIMDMLEKVNMYEQAEAKQKGYDA